MRIDGQTRGRTVTRLLIALVGLSLLPLPSSGAQSAPEGGAPAAVDTSVAAQIAADGSADFWVDFAESADLSGAAAISDWTARGQYVVDQLTSTADASQASLAADLTKRKVSHQRFWAANTILVQGGDHATLDAARTTAGVSRIRARASYSIPEPIKGAGAAAINAVEWGIANINADDVWSTFTDRGEGIVIANIDTGVQFDHPALVDTYRGNLGGGSFDHNYSWFDPSAICASPSPCDNNDHGSHTMGTMAGDDGGSNQIGVAPGVEWIAAKGCESNSCSDTALLASGQWMLAPTDLAGLNPDPSKRPHIVNNSWGGDNGGAVDGWYRSTLTAWTAAGIFGVFSNGNAGPSCDTSGSPGDNLEAYSVGAYDVANTIGSFSSRGPGENGDVRPDISAPGVSVRSSVSGNGYSNFNGTSMAAPHVSGTVALMWSRAPALVGDITLTRSILDATAIDTNDVTCGGTAANNNIYGEGRLDALTAVAASPAGPSGSMAGMVKEKGTGTPIAGATVSTTVFGLTRSTTSAADGSYTLTSLPVDTYNVTASVFAYKSKTSAVTITEGNTTTKDFSLVPKTANVVSGTVKAGGPIGNAIVTIVGTPIPPATTDASGEFSFAGVPNGTYTFNITYGGCAAPLTTSKHVNGPESFTFLLTRATDTYGHVCDLKVAGWINGTTQVVLTGDDASAAVPLPFPVSFYGTSYATANVSTNGNLNFLAANTAFGNTAIPAAAAPNAAIYPQWDDLYVDPAANGGVWTRTQGSAPNRRFTIEWRNVRPFDGAESWDLEVVIYETGKLLFQYNDVDAARDSGSSATVGIENAAGNDALQYSLNLAVLTNGTAIEFSRAAPTPFRQPRSIL